MHTPDNIAWRLSFAIDYLTFGTFSAILVKYLDVFGYGGVVFEHDKNLSFEISYIYF